MGDENYTNVLVYEGDALLAQATRIRVRRQTGSQPVATIALGHAGESPGVSMCEIEVSSAVPMSGFEVDAGTFMATLKRAKLTFYAGGQKLTSRGQMVDDSLEYSVGQAASYDFSFRGKFGQWEKVT